MGKKNVLFVAYQFPPLAVGGSYRPYKFVKQLVESNSSVNPIVLSLAPASYKTVYGKYNEDQAAYKVIQSLGVKVYHATSKGKKRWSRWQNFLEIYFNVHKGNEAKYWKESFDRAFDEIIAKEKIELVYVTCPPFSIGTLVRKKLQTMDSIPLLVDMRDNWTWWLSQPFGSRIHYWTNRWFEKQLYKAATAVVGVTPEHVGDLKKMAAHQEKKFHFIPNAFEGAVVPEKTYTKEEGKLVVAYVGAFYYNPENENLLSTKWYKRKGHKKLFYWPRKEYWIYRSPYYFLSLVQKVRETYPNVTIQLNIAGYETPWLQGMVNQFGLQESVQFFGFLGGEKLEQFYQESDMLLLTSVKVAEGKDYCIASKTYDYLQTGKRILGVVTEGAQKNFLKASCNALLVNPDRISASLEEVVQIAMSTEIETINNEQYLERYRIEKTTKQLEQLMLQLIEKS